MPKSVSARSPLRRRQQAFFNTAADLAFRNHHRQQGEPSKPGQTARDDLDRERLIALRRELTPDSLLRES